MAALEVVEMERKTRARWRMEAAGDAGEEVSREECAMIVAGCILEHINCKWLDINNL